jgi:hypothetical protein
LTKELETAISLNSFGPFLLSPQNVIFVKSEYGSGTFGFTWTPDITGNYTVTATFQGSGGYYGSSAETHIYASSPAATATSQPAQAQPPTGTYITEATAAIIATIVIVGIVLGILVLRKRP